MSDYSLIKDQFSASESALQIEQASMADHIATVLADLIAHPEAEDLAMMVAYASGRDPEAISYLAARSYAASPGREQSLAKLIVDLQAFIEVDFENLALFKILIEPLFDPLDTLSERMEAVKCFALGDNELYGESDAIAA